MPTAPLRILAVMLIALAATAAVAGAAPRHGTYGTRLGSHTMIYLDTPPAQQRAMFRASAEAGVRHLRMDFAIGLVFQRDRTDFSAVDRVNALAARYEVEVLGVVTTTPWYIVARPGGAVRSWPAPAYERTWRDMVFAVARRASNVRHWELGNEPDNDPGFARDGHGYALWAALAAEGIRAAQPHAVIAIGGFAHLNEGFIAAALNDPVHPLRRLTDVANIHLRGTLATMRPSLAIAIACYRRLGFSGPVWVTETGYPSRPEHQWDPLFARGPRDQARWLVRGVRRLIAGGAGAVFVSFRDTREFGRSSPFASEGVLCWPRLDRHGRARPKPAYAALRRLAAQPLPR